MISNFGESVALAQALEKEKHELSFFIKKRPYKKIGDGLVNKVSDPGSLFTKSDLIIVDDIGSGAFVDKAKKMGHSVIGPGTAIENLATDFSLMIDVLSALKVKIATDKTEGQMAVVGAWFDGEKFIKPILVGTKYVRFAAGDLGPVTRGTGICAMSSIRSKLFHETLSNLQAFLASVNFVGFISLDCLINNDTVHVKSIHPSLGFPNGIIMSEMFLNSAGDFLKKLYNKEVSNAPVRIDRIHVGIPIFVPNWPILLSDSLVEINTPAFIPIGVSKEEDYIQMRIDGLAGMAVGHGSSVVEARNIAYKAANKIKHPNVLYRNDIELDNQFNRLREKGWWK